MVEFKYSSLPEYLIADLSPLPSMATDSRRKKSDHLHFPYPMIRK